MKRARTGARSRAGVARRRRPRYGIPRSGKYKNQKGLKRKQFVAKAPKAFAHRNQSARTEVAWPLVPVPGPLPPGLTPLIVSVPKDTWGSYQRGFDVQQITSQAIFSRNVTCRLELQPPVKSGAAQAYQFRIVTGFCKRQLIKVMASTQGTSGMSDGIVLNFTPQEFEDLALQTCSDFIGVQNGNGDGRGAVDRTAIDVVSDSNIVIHADTTDATGSTYYPTKVMNYNWATKNTMRLYPYSTSADIPQSGIPDGYTPVNNATVWVPFICLFINNREDFQAAPDAPSVQTTWTHYWDQL